MNLYIRLILVLIAAFRGPKHTDILQPTRLKMRVLPNDLDLNFHMNNGRYLTILDLGRIDFIVRMKITKQLWRRGCRPVLSAAQIRYRLPLNPFQRFDLETKILCWDEQMFFIEQRFILADGPKIGAVAAIALIKGGFYIPREKKMAALPPLLTGNAAIASPPYPAYIVAWQKAEEALRSVTSASA